MHFGKDVGTFVRPEASTDLLFDLDLSDTPLTGIIVIGNSLLLKEGKEVVFDLDDPFPESLKLIVKMRETFIEKPGHLVHDKKHLSLSNLFEGCIFLQSDCTMQ